MGWGTMSAAPFIDFPSGHADHDNQNGDAARDYNLQGHRVVTDSNRNSAPASHFPEGQWCPETQRTTALGDSNFTRGHSGHETQESNAPGEPDQPTTKSHAESKTSSSSAPTSPAGHPLGDDQHPGACGGSEASESHVMSDTHRKGALGPKPADDQREADPHGCSVVGTKPAAAQESTETHLVRDGSDQTSTTGHAACEAQTPFARGGWLRDPVLGILADVLDDYENVRIANENRVRQLTRTEEDSDGVERGFGLTLDHPNVARLQASVVALADAEADAVKNLQKAMKSHPLGPWVKSQAGVGEKQAARLIAAIGDPYWNDLHQRPRTVSELWAYCGYAVNNGHVQARRRGEQANWSADAKMRVFLIAASCIKQPAAKSKYRRIYDDARAKYADAEHPHECKRCGPAGKPAPGGSPLSAGHQHARAMRLMSKEILKDLWIESKRLYEETSHDPA